MKRYVIPDLLRSAAERWPDKVAVTAGDESLSYAALDMAADRVAGALAEMGVAPSDRVGVHAEKSIEAVAAIYGIMRTGGTYVPIDPHAPPQRCAYIARNCAVSAVVSDSNRILALRDCHPDAAPRGITVDGIAPAQFATWEAVQAAAAPAPARRIVETDLAYILYTSGSSGEPKGVMISHRNSLSFVEWARHRLELQEEDVFSNHAPFHFDLSVLDLFAAAMVGGRVCCVPPSAAMFPVRLTQWILREKISVWYSVPSALSLLALYGHLEGETLDSLRLVIFAGEVFPTKFLSKLMSLLPQARFLNLYGPTETNVCTYYEVPKAPAPNDPPIPIGIACENGRCLVVDDDGTELTSPGDEGELLVQGPTVAQGYWADSEKTARGFVAPSTYRTGDLVRVLDGPPDRLLLAFIGRRDHMVKSRGYRIELGEIEAALYSHPDVEEACVVTVPDELLGSRLVAFCSAAGYIDEATLERTCRSQLPAYMVPERFSITPKLPKTSSGKIDRRRLSELAQREPQEAGSGR